MTNNAYVLCLTFDICFATYGGDRVMRESPLKEGGGDFPLHCSIVQFSGYLKVKHFLTGVIGFISWGSQNEMLVSVIFL